MQKSKRLLAIEKIIAEENISSQEELLKRLKSLGISGTQATLSRNLREIGVGRIPDGNGSYKYSLPGNGRNFVLPEMMVNIVPVIKDIVEAKGMMIIKTIPGNASSTAFFIDGTGRYEIAGTIAGDDTILLIPRDGVSLKQIHNCLEIILPGIHHQIRNR